MVNAPAPAPADITQAADQLAQTTPAADSSLSDLSDHEARLLQSEEHKALGHRPPPTSLAAAAQSSASKHAGVPEAELNREELRDVAQLDAARVKAEAEEGEEDLVEIRGDVLNVGGVTEKEARKLESEEHKALGYRPPAGSLAASAKSAAARNSVSSSSSSSGELNRAQLREAAQVDAVLVDAVNGGVETTSAAKKLNLDLDSIGEKEARKLESEEHKALGYRPPPGSLASVAKAAAAKHPQGNGTGEGLNRARLRDVAAEDAARIEEEREGGSVGSGGSSGGSGVGGVGSVGSVGPEGKVGKVDLSTITEKEARKLMSEEHKILGYRPPPGSLAAEAQAAAARRGSVGEGGEGGAKDGVVVVDGNGNGNGGGVVNGNGNAGGGNGKGGGKKSRELNRRELREAAAADAARIERTRKAGSDSGSGSGSGSASPEVGWEGGEEQAGEEEEERVVGKEGKESVVVGGVDRRDRSVRA